MTSHLVEGHPLPDAVAGHPALELCNTRAIWGSPAPKEYLHDYATLLLWGREHEVLTPAECADLRAAAEVEPAVAALVLRQVLRLRDVIYALVTADRDPAVEASMHRLVAGAVRRSTYQRLPDGRLDLDGGAGLAIPLHRLALAAHGLLACYGPDAVGRCHGEGCGWVFLDPTRRRHWCVMAVCGNRAKVRRFAARRREGPALRRSAAPAG
jgi:predicted RNA-binding Zn ribbon-like protein